MRFSRAAALTCAVVAAGMVRARELSLDERFAAQKAIEQVYWSHRIWPKENPGPKPPLSDVLPDDAIRKKVAEALRMSALLDSYWHEPLTGERLQAEVTRMARSTKSPAMLRELFAALHDDPFLIAECVARPALAQRRVETLFGSEERIHGAQRTALSSRLSDVSSLGELDEMDGQHAEITLVLESSAGATMASSDPKDRGVHLNSEEWRQEMARLASEFGLAQPNVPVGTHGSLPVGHVSRLIDRRDRFMVMAVRSRTATSVTIATVSWPKRSFVEWARTIAGSAKLNTQAASPPISGYVLPMLEPSACTDDTWRFTAGSEVPDARANHSAVWTGSEMIVWGGNSAYLNTGGRYDPATDAWLLSSLTTGSGANVPAGRELHTAVWTGTEMIVWGGEGANYLAMNTGGRYNPVTDSWAACSLTTGSGANVPVAREVHTAIWTGTEMIIWGGSGGQLGAAQLSTGGRYNPVTDSWAPSSLTTGSGANVPTARLNHTAVWTGSEMIIWGGEDLSLNYVSTGGRYDPASDSWAATSLIDGTGANIPDPRTKHTAVWTGSEMIIWGGSRTNPYIYLNTGGRYDPSTDSWVASSLTTGSGPRVPQAREQHTAVWTGSEMIVWGGRGDLPYYLNTGGRYDPSTDTWADSSLVTGTGANVPVGRYGHTAVWTGSEMLVWGGWDGASNLYDTGGRYDPTQDSWAAGSLSTGLTPNLPELRVRNTAVWTGSEMIVWGGAAPIGGTLNLDTGGRYDPATNAWASTELTTGSGANVPSPRKAHSAIWTGTEMLVWGGSQFESDFLSTGGRYNPTTDTWVPSSLTTGIGPNVPEGRYGHTAVWTGSEMIVWGGATALTPSGSSSGGRFDPSTDRWAASSLTTGTGANLPARGLVGHTAIWTGSEMIVWGWNTGGRYNPSTDAWAASSLTSGSGANVPSSRLFHTAIWTGTEMIVWGGQGDYGTLSNGGRYDPVVDAWVASSLTSGSGVNVPGPRYTHSAVWTGTEMIVWGGLDGISYFPINTGGRYSPYADSWAASSLGTASGASVPRPRNSHNAVWTGTEMIIWGGYPATHSGGLYCASCRPHLWYLDADGDGRGDPASSVTSCVAPIGYVAVGGDCDDTNPSVHAGAVEVCNGLDDNCNGATDEDGASLCDDADVCTNDLCHAGVCSHAPCDDADVCTADGCNPAIGCYSKSINMDTTRFSANRIDGRDLTVLANAWNSCPGDYRYTPIANLDMLSGPGACIDMSDFHLFMNAFGRTCSTGAAP